MSLSVYLVKQTEPCHCCGHQEEPEWFYTAIITHNLGKMADHAGIYKALWRPEEIGIKSANELIPLLENGLAMLKADPEKFKQYDAPNGWGVYDNLVCFVRDYLEACKVNPEASVEVSR